MKRIVPFLFFLIATGLSFAQTNITNGDFETWYTVTVSPTLTYEDIGTGPNDNWMATLNTLATVPASMSGPGPITVLKTTDKHSGTYAAKAVSGSLSLGVVNVFIPGMIGTAKLDFPGVRAILGKPCAECKPVKFKGYFKFEPVNGDSCSAILLLSKWNSASKKRDTIGYGRFVQKEAVNSWQPFEVVPTYRSSGSIDSITLLVVSSAGFSVVNFMGAVGQVGNTMYVDDLMLEYPAGVEQSLMPDVSVKVSPNPASDMIRFDFDREIRGGQVLLFNQTGQTSGSYPVSGNSLVIPVSTLPSGIYHFSVRRDNQSLHTGSFIISR
jgi:hypothetical protein